MNRFGQSDSQDIDFIITIIIINNLKNQMESIHQSWQT